MSEEIAREVLLKVIREDCEPVRQRISMTNLGLRVALLDTPLDIDHITHHPACLEELQQELNFIIITCCKGYMAIMRAEEQERGA